MKSRKTNRLKGVVLAGGLGRRLEPLTRVTNKHLLPVWNRPMIYYPLTTLVEAGIKEILMITGGNNAADFSRLLGKGEEFGLKQLSYAYQRGEGGIADALKLAENFARGCRLAVILGDNIFERPIKKYVNKFKRQNKGARILIKRTRDPQRFGVVNFNHRGIAAIEEKPKRPKSRYVVTGIYMYDEQVFDMIRGLKPSWRNELEITDVNNTYLKKGQLAYDVLDGYWTDCGTFDSLLKANRLIAGSAGKKK